MSTAVKTALISAGAAVIVAAVSLLGRSSAPDSIPSADRIEITSPADNAVVSQVTAVEIESSVRGAEVWCIVHPVGSDQYWVQPRAEKINERLWRVDPAYFGDSRTRADTRFQIRAICNPKVQLKEGDLLRTWPAGELASGIRVVSRS